MLQEQAVSPHLLASLRNLMGASALNEFRLVGGTALTLYLGHRISDDVDLFTDNREVPILELKSILIKDYKCRIKDEYIDFLKGNCFGFSCNDKKIRYDIQIKSTKFIDPPQHIDGIRLASLRDIAISKLYAITERVTKRDYIDLYYLQGAIDIADVFSNGFFSVFPPEKAKRVLASLASSSDVMNNALKMPKMISELDIKQLSSTLTLVARNCYESRKTKKVMVNS